MLFSLCQFFVNTISAYIKQYGMIKVRAFVDGAPKMRRLIP
jgi:hypothetical protein